MAEQPKAQPNKEKDEGGRFTVGLSNNPTVTLAQAGIDKNLAHRARTLAKCNGLKARRCGFSRRSTRLSGRPWPLLGSGHSF
jgi:hypothetical protein